MSKFESSTSIVDLRPGRPIIPTTTDIGLFRSVLADVELEDDGAEVRIEDGMAHLLGADALSRCVDLETIEVPQAVRVTEHYANYLTTRAMTPLLRVEYEADFSFLDPSAKTPTMPLEVHQSLSSARGVAELLHSSFINLKDEAMTNREVSLYKRWMGISFATFESLLAQERNGGNSNE